MIKNPESDLDGLGLQLWSLSFEKLENLLTPQTPRWHDFEFIAKKSK